MASQKKVYSRRAPGYMSIVHPNRDVQVLARALKETQDIVGRWKRDAPEEPLSLFLEGHYPFFDERVQSILLERHPDRFATSQADWPYAIDAYIWAERYAWTAYDDSPFKTGRSFEEFADFYFVND